ncbi:MAG: hypothetical protein LBN32_00750 [Helicobacteraceae bacterium]|jgi:hypothetical protein|nr:hypothetical protein [Helicobacteraceae bacterium]
MMRFVIGALFGALATAALNSETVRQFARESKKRIEEKISEQRNTIESVKECVKKRRRTKNDAAK